jgi:predicted nucleic acid-binding Zn ribbon protein
MTMKPLNVPDKNCLYCGDPIKGRIDKKFCNDYCRNYYNYQQKTRNQNSCVRKINGILLKNCRILENLLTTEKTIRVTRETLDLLGFHFGFFTHQFTNHSGQTYYYCYHHGYLGLPDDKYLIVKQNPLNPS